MTILTILDCLEDNQIRLTTACEPLREKILILLGKLALLNQVYLSPSMERIYIDTNITISMILHIYF